jgi:N-acylneuraminate cytidylyltransferase
MWRIEGESSFLQPLVPGDFHEPYNMPRQHLPKVYWQTGHIDAVRYETIVRKQSLTGERVLPLLIDRQYCVDIDTELEWRYAESLLSSGIVEIVLPKGGSRQGRPSTFSLPGTVSLLVLDFDGVLTDNRVWVTEDEVEAVVCSRSDGMGLAMLRKSGIEAIVLSTETNPVVAARCRKLDVPCWQGIENKEMFLRTLMRDRELNSAQVIYVGNDLNDLGCMRLAGYAVAVCDAHPEVLRAADWILTKAGGRGAVRELCDLIVTNLRKRSDTHA